MIGAKPLVVTLGVACAGCNVALGLGDYTYTGTPSTPGTTLWLETHGGTGPDSSSALLVGPGGDIFVAGCAGTGDQSMNEACSSTAYINLERLGPEGVAIWNERLGSSTTFSSGTCLALGAKDLLVSGQFAGQLTLGNDKLNAPIADVFYARIDELSGTPIGGRQYGGAAGSQYPFALTPIDKTSYVLSGAFNGTIGFGLGTALASAPGSIAPFFVKLDENGNAAWQASASTTTVEVVQPYALAYGPTNDHVYAAGNVAGSANFGGQALAAAIPDAFLATLDAKGNTLSAKLYGNATGPSAIDGIAIDHEGNVVITGTFAGSIDLGTGMLASRGGRDVFVAKLTPDGNTLWSQSFGDTLDDYAFSVAVDGSGNVIVSGSLSGTMAVGKMIALESAGGFDAFVMKLDPEGSPIWARRFGGMENDYGGPVAVASTDAVIFAGSFRGSVDFDAHSAKSAGSLDAFVLELAP